VPLTLDAAVAAAVESLRSSDGAGHNAGPASMPGYFDGTDTGVKWIIICMPSSLARDVTTPVLRFMRNHVQGTYLDLLVGGPSPASNFGPRSPRRIRPRGLMYSLHARGVASVRHHHQRSSPGVLPHGRKPPPHHTPPGTPWFGVPPCLTSSPPPPPNRRTSPSRLSRTTTSV